METKKGAIYARVSTDKQEYTRQLEELKEYANRNNISIEYIFEETESGLNSERPEYNKLINLTKEDIDIVLIWELSRLSRKSIEIQTDIRNFKNKGINVFIYDRGISIFDSNGEENSFINMLIGMLSAVAEEEIKTMKKRVVATKRHNVFMKGYSYTSHPPFGYTRVEKKMVISEPEAKIVKEIFDLSINGSSQYSIAVKLNADGVPTTSTKNALWSASTVSKMLQNTAYYGKAKYLDTFIDCPAIISKETFDLSQIKRKQRLTRSATKVGNTFLLRNLIKCKHCGTYFTNAKDKIHHQYKCTRLMNRTFQESKCTSPAVNFHNMNYLIWDIVSRYFREVYVDDRKRNNEANLLEAIEDKNRIKQSIDNEIKKENKKVGIIYSGLQELKIEFPDLIDLQEREKKKLSNIQSNIKRLNSEKEMLDNEIASLKSRMKDLSDVENMDLTTLDYNTKYDFLHRFIDYIYITKNVPDKSKLYYGESDKRYKVEIFLKSGNKVECKYHPQKKEYTINGVVNDMSEVPDGATAYQVTDKTILIEQTIKFPSVVPKIEPETEKAG
ncbi:recombinase family protein [Proteiniphilum acetatigenes]|uniref:recombinase family protein n=1 Tax=Proteiniphilum acetatigenes TaxID=294710 RepID=UPI00037A29B5|nr:recombinase family protein [Proteiniphilum acetatigenes]